MIHPSQLTREAGFEDGVVVEIARSTHRYEFPEVGRIKFPMGSLEESPIIYVGGVLMGLQDITSIRPLTGSMAIWNFAPEWATCCQSREMGISWEHKIPEWWDGKSTVIQLRPWWCK